MTLLTASSDATLGRLRLAATAHIEFEAAAATGDDDAPRRPTFAIVGYTGAPMRLAGYASPVVVDLAGLRARSQAIPVLRDHDPSRIVGQTSGIEVAADAVRLVGFVTGENADAGEVVSQARNGFAWRASIGASPIRQEFLRAGEKSTVNGREVNGPLVITREAVLEEISFVALAADGQTSAVVAASGASFGEGTKVFEDWLKALGFDPAALTETQRTKLRATFDAAKGDGNDDDPQARGLDQVMKARRDEDRRVGEITRIAASAMDSSPGRVDEIEAMARVAITSRQTPERFELDVLRASRPTAQPFAARGRDSAASGQVIEAALCLSGGISDPESHFDERTLDAANRAYPHGLGLRDLFLTAARANGYTGSTSSDLRAILDKAFIRASGFSTIALPGILSNTANKFLVAGFDAVEDSWRKIASVRSVRDFKQVTSYSLTGGMTYEKVGPGGELKHATVGQTLYLNKVESYGRMFAITRQDLVNDDLGALTDVPKKLGRGAALKLNDVFWAQFLADVSTFWSVSHANVSTGSGSALGSTGLKNALQTFRKQTDPDGMPIGATPAILLVPPELEITATELMTSALVNTGGASTTDKVPSRNVWASKFEVVTSTYISNAAYTGYSAAAWFLLARPDDLSTIEVAFLNGRQAPVVESADADFGTLGIQMRGYHDFGVAKQEFRASVRSNGS